MLALALSSLGAMTMAAAAETAVLVDTSKVTHQVDPMFMVCHIMARLRKVTPGAAATQ